MYGISFGDVSCHFPSYISWNSAQVVSIWFFSALMLRTGIFIWVFRLDCVEVL